MLAFPDNFTHIGNVDFKDLKSILKTINITDDNDILQVLLLFENIGLIIRDNYLIKVNPDFKLLE